MKKSLAALLAVLIGTLVLSNAAFAREDRLQEKLITISESIQYPGSESDSTWTFVSYPGKDELPDAEQFQRFSGCPAEEDGTMTRLDFDVTLDRLGAVQPWMDEGQRDSAMGFRKMYRVYHRKFGEEVVVYRCETGTAEVYLYFVGLDRRPEVDRLAGLFTVSIET